jgi:hypothetical protein
LQWLSFETAALWPLQSLTQKAANGTGFKAKLVMPGLVPGIHVFHFIKKDVDGRDEARHDEMPDAFSVIRLGMTEGSSLVSAAS